MTDLLFNIRVEEATYKLKEGTKDSYYRQSGSTILPNRMSIDFQKELTYAQKKGRMLIERVIGEVRGSFKKTEQSPLKQHPPYGIHSKIFRPQCFPLVNGYATIAISNKEGKISKDSEEGLAAFFKADDGMLHIFFCAGINPSEKDKVLAYISQKIKEGVA